MAAFDGAMAESRTKVDAAIAQCTQVFNDATRQYADISRNVTPDTTAEMEKFVRFVES